MNTKINFYQKPAGSNGLDIVLEKRLEREAEETKKQKLILDIYKIMKKLFVLEQNILFSRSYRVNYDRISNVLNKKPLQFIELTKKLIQEYFIVCYVLSFENKVVFAEGENYCEYIVINSEKTKRLIEEAVEKYDYEVFDRVLTILTGGKF